MSAGDEPHRSPYVGLVPYTEEDAAWFFGREHEQTIITANLRGSRLTLLYGASGVGKSSILGAGVVPKLRALVRANRELPVRAARGGASPERAPLAVVVFREWRDQPLAPFMDAVRAAVVEATGEDVEAWEQGQAVVQALHAWTQRVRTVLVILDQFEEFFLYHRRERGPGTFAGEFPSIVNEPDLRVNVLLSLREDAWSQLDRFKGDVPHLFANYVRVPYLDREAGRRAITGPIDEYNRRLAPGEEPVTIEPELVDRVLDEVPTGRLTLGGEGDAAIPVAADSGDDRIETPFMQLVMEQLWIAATAGGGRVLDHATLDALGGAKAIVSGHLAEAMRALDPAQVAVAAEVLRYLVTPARTKVAQDVATLTEWTKLPRDDVAHVLEELAGARRILRVVPSPDDDPGSTRYEIFHDVLGESILDWRRGYEQEREKAALAAELEADQQRRRELEIARNRKRRRRLGLLVGCLLVLVGVTIGILLYKHNQEVAHAAALSATAEAQLAIDPELSVLLSQSSLEHNDTPAGRAILRESLSVSRLRGALRNGRARPCPDCALAALSRPVLVAAPVAVSPDGRRVAAATPRGVAVWDPRRATGRTAAARDATLVGFSPDGRRSLVAGDGGLALLDGGGAGPRRIEVSPTYSAAFSPDGRSIAAATENGAVVYDAAEGRPRADLDAYANTVAFSPDGSTVLVAAADEVVLWSWRSDRTRRLELAGSLVPTAAAPAPLVAAFSADARRVAVGRADGRTRIYDAATGRLLQEIPPTPRPVSAVVFSPNGRRLLTTADKDANLWDTGTGALVAALRGHAARITAATFSADGALLATASEDGTIRVWDAGANAPTMILRGHGAAVDGVAFSGDGRKLVSSGGDGTVRVWDVSTGRVLRGRNWMLDAAFDDDGRRVATAGADHVVRLWTPVDGDSRILYRNRADTFDGVAFRRGIVLVGGEQADIDGDVRAIDAASGRVLWARRLEQGGVAQVAISADGRRGLSVSRNGRAFVWDMATGRRRLLYVDPDDFPLSDGALSRDGRLALIAGGHGRALVLDPDSGKQIAMHVMPASAGDDVLAAAFSPDSRSAATSEGQNIAVWDPRTGRTRLLLVGHEGPVAAVAFSPDGRRVVSGGADRSVRVWDAHSGALLAVLRDHSDYVDSVSFSPDGHSILSASDDFTAKVTTCDTCGDVDQLLRLASARTTRSLTEPQEDRLIQGHR